MHVLDFEPMWSPATHALSTTLPTVLALAECRQSSGQEILTALVKGIEVQGWMREAGHAPASDLGRLPPARRGRTDRFGCGGRCTCSD